MHDAENHNPADPETKTLIIMSNGHAASGKPVMGALSVMGGHQICLLADMLKVRIPRLDAILHSPTDCTTETARIVQDAFSGQPGSKALLLPSEDLAPSAYGWALPDDRWNSVCHVTHPSVIDCLKEMFLIPSGFAGRDGELIIMRYASPSWDRISRATRFSWEVLGGNDVLWNLPRAKTSGPHWKP